MNLAKTLLRLAGWKVDITAPQPSKCMICVAPHTSNWDFFLGKLAYASVGRQAGFLMKDFWFFWPLGPIFRAMGGIPVPRKRPKGASLVETLVERFRTSEHLAIAITPEGTRSRTARWHTGFLQIAWQAQIPCLLGVIDAKNRTVIVRDTFHPTGDIEADMRAIKAYYRPYEGIRPDSFCADDCDS